MFVVLCGRGHYCDELSCIDGGDGEAVDYAQLGASVRVVERELVWQDESSQNVNMR